MGTSTSNKGPRGGVSFDPPWLSKISATIYQNTPPASDPPNMDDSGNQVLAASLPGRFRLARAALREFIKDGNRQNYGKVLGHYSKTGMGGAKQLSSRMKVSSKAAGALFNFISDINKNQNIANWLASLGGRKPSLKEVENRIINLLVSEGGSLEEESCKNSISQAISELIEIYPEIDLLSISLEQTWVLIERFLANECLSRFFLDVGQLFESSKYNPELIANRLGEMKEYLNADLKSSLDALRAEGFMPDSQAFEALIAQSIVNTFKVYEGEI